MDTQPFRQTLAGVLGSSPVAVTETLDFAPASSKEFLDIQATIQCAFTLKHLRDMRETCS